MPEQLEVAGKAKILIVEDEIMLAKDLARSLRNFGYEITGRVSSAEEAFRIVEGSKPDLILMDIRLEGGTDGIQAAERIRSRFDIPVVYLTGFAEKDFLERAKRTEPYGYLSKPIGLLELRSTIETAVYRHRADRRVKESEEKFRSAFEYSGVGMALVALDGRFLSVNRAVSSILGYSEAEMLELNYTDITHPQDLEEITASYRGLLAGEMDHFEVEKRYVHKKGHNVWGRLNIALVRDSAGTPLYSVAQLNDITQNKRAQAQLSENLATMEALVAKAADGFCVCHEVAEEPYLRFTHWNPRMAQLTGYTMHEINQVGWYQAVYPDPQPRQEAIERMIQMRKGDDLEAEEWDITTKTGTKKTLSISTSVIKEQQGQVHVLALMRDVTERKAFISELDRKRRLLEKAERLAGVGAWEWDFLKNQFYMSEEWLRIHGTEDPGLSRGKLMQMAHPKDRDAITHAFEDSIEKGIPFDVVHRIVRPNDGEERIMRNYGQLTKDASGNPVRLYGAAQDITERERAEKQIKASLAEKEVLLREIHHRVKNNFALINSLLSLQSEYSTDKTQQELFDEVKTRIRSMAVAHEILYRSENLGHLSVPDFIANLLNHILYAHKKVGTSVSLEKEIEDLSLGLDTAIPLGFLLTELVSNCLKHAFPDEREGRIRLNLRSVNEHEFEMTVADNGVGIPESIDWENPQSMGLDLIDTFVEQLRGRIEFSRKDGTEVSILFKEIGHKAQV